MENKEQKKKQIQVGVVCHFQRDKRGRILPETTVSEPIYRDWTPELQAAEDRMLSNFAEAIYEDMKKYIINGGDLSKLDTPEGQEHYKAYRQKQIDEQKRKTELRKVKNKMTDEELEEFLKWKESKNS